MRGSFKLLQRTFTVHLIPDKYSSHIMVLFCRFVQLLDNNILLIWNSNFNLNEFVWTWPNATLSQILNSSRICSYIIFYFKSRSNTSSNKLLETPVENKMRVFKEGSKILTITNLQTTFPWTSFLNISYFLEINSLFYSECCILTFLVQFYRLIIAL